MSVRSLIAPLAILALFVLPAFAEAQATSGSITGVVRDTSGAVLPGATVEAASPALLEKVRTAVTDGTGQYRVENLPHGTYKVPYSLTGCIKVGREGLQVPAGVTRNVDAEVR